MASPGPTSLLDVADECAVGRDDTRPRWPPPTPALPADDFYARLLRQLDVPERASSSVWEAVRRSARRVLDLVRPHALDVDAFVCGSFASGTQVAAGPLAVDVAVRFYEARPRWRRDPLEALEEVRSWLTYGISVDTEPASRAITLPVADRIAIRLMPCWRGDDGAPLIGPDPAGESEALRFDPAGHRDLLLARQASLGSETAFLGLIRIVKLLIQRWAKPSGRKTLSSYHVDTLALNLCREPFTLAEGVADFLHHAARATRGRLEDPARFGLATSPAEPNLASAMFSEAAEQAEAALMSSGAREADEILGELFDCHVDQVEQASPPCLPDRRAA